MSYTDKVMKELERQMQIAVDNGATCIYDIWYHVYFVAKLPYSYAEIETAYSDIVQIKRRA